MRKNIIAIFAILILPLFLYYYLDKSQAVSANKVNNSQPTVIKFASDMCGECKKMDKVVNQVYPKYADKIALVKVPVQKQDKQTQELIKKYNVTLIPTLIFKKSNGEIMSRVEGSMDNTTFEQYLKRLLNE